MKRFFSIFIAVLAVLALAACAKPQPEATPEPTLATAEPEPTTEPTPEPAPAPTPEPASLSYTTGLPFEGYYRPVMAVIENSDKARPQTGLQMADVVYEVPVEGSITRFVCVFSDYIPDGIMPVRSGRVPFLYIQHEWDAVFMHFGGTGSGSNTGEADFYRHPLYQRIKVDVDGLRGKWSSYFERVKGKSAPHDVNGAVKEAQMLYDYEPQPLPWLFGDAAYAGDTAADIALPMASGKANFVTYAYDAGSDVYLRSMGGKPFKAAETDAQVSVKNIIVQYSTYKTVYGVKLWKLTGGGDADFYIGGKLVKGRWERQSEEDPTMFYDAQGNQIVLKPGNTWIHIHPAP